MTKKATIVLVASGLITHIGPAIIDELNLDMPWLAKGILYGISPLVVFFLMLGYAYFNKFSVLKISVIALLFDTAITIVICISEAVQGNLPPEISALLVLQFWGINVLLWSPLALALGAFLLYMSQPKIKVVGKA